MNILGGKIAVKSEYGQGSEFKFAIQISQFEYKRPPKMGIQPQRKGNTNTRNQIMNILEDRQALFEGDRLIFDWKP